MNTTGCINYGDCQHNHIDCEIDNPFFKCPKYCPPPGSNEAIEKGCKCPVLDNAHGRGVYLDENKNPVYWFSSDCPLHCG